MKHLKKLSVVLMLTALFSVTFTSCIDNEVSPVVEAIYEAQADLIAAQAGVQNAEAAYLLARAEAEQAQAAWTTAQAAQVDAITAGIEETNSYNALRNDQAILLLVAQTNRDVAAAENAMELAQVVFERAMQTAIAAMEAAGAQIAVGYAWDYANAMNHANYLMSQLLGAQGDLADAQLMLTGIAGSEVSYAYHLAQLQNAVSVKESEIAVAEANLATLEAHAADPIAAKEILEAQKTTLKAQYEDLLQQEVAQQNVIDALNFEVGDRNITVSQLASALNDHNNSLTTRITREGWIATAETNIALWETALANYPAALAAATTAVTTTTAAYTAAWTALGEEDASGNTPAFGLYFMIDADEVAIAAGGEKYAAPANLQEVYVNARIDLADATAELSTIQGEIAALYGALQTAINNLASAQSSYDSGIATITGAVTTAEGAVTTAEGALATAQSYYAAKQTIFEASPTGLTWFDQTTPLGGLTAETSPFPNTRIGNHADVIATSYAYVTGWVEAPVGTWTPTTLSAATVATFPVTAVAYAAPVVSGTIPSVLATTGYYVEVEADDLSATNAALLNDAVAKLGDNAIYDVAPALPATYPIVPVTYLMGTDAYTVLYNAELALLEAEYALDNYDTALVAAQAAYDYQKNLFDNELTILDAAQAAKASATTADAAAKKAVDNAWTALGVEYVPGTAVDAKKTTSTAGAWYYVNFVSGTKALTANAVVFNAEVDKAILVANNAASIQLLIDGALANVALWTEQITNIQVFIDAKYAVVSGLLGVLTADGVEWTFEVDEDGYGTFNVTNDTVLGASYSDLRAELIAESQVLWTIQRDIAAVQSERTAVNDLLSQWNTSYNTFVNTTIPGLKSSLVLLETGLEQALAALALATNAETAAEANIAYLEALIDTLEARHANTLVIAAKYKALMEAALAS